MNHIVINGQIVVSNEYEYEVGEVIKLNSTEPAKCIGKETINGEVHHHFVKGKQVVTYELEFVLGQPVWFHENGSLEGQAAIVAEKSGQLYKGTDSYVVKIEATGREVKDVKPSAIRPRSKVS